MVNTEIRFIIFFAFKDGKTLYSQQKQDWELTVAQIMNSLYTVEVRNRFKGLDLIDRVPDELWMEVGDIVQETGIKTIPMEKKCKKAQWLSEEAVQIVVKRREGEKQRRKRKI